MHIHESQAIEANRENRSTHENETNKHKSEGRKDMTKSRDPLKVLYYNMVSRTETIFDLIYSAAYCGVAQRTGLVLNSV